MYTVPVCTVYQYTQYLCDTRQQIDFAFDRSAVDYFFEPVCSFTYTCVCVLFLFLLYLTNEASYTVETAVVV